MLQLLHGKLQSYSMVNISCQWYLPTICYLHSLQSPHDDLFLHIKVITLR